MDKKISLTPDELSIVCDGNTEMPNSGAYNHHQGQGTYLCRRCGIALFRSEQKFLSSCGWPSFDDEIANRIKRHPDADGYRTEIACARCHAHLGHVFCGEHLTAKNLRHCVNSLAIDFVKSTTIGDSEEAIVAGGCFWGMQYLFEQLEGVVKTEVGYSGGDVDAPNYEQVCQKQTGHLEALRIVYDPSIINYEAILKFFFEIHDATQTDGQGPDIGSQYLSGIFYYNEQQKDIADKLIFILKHKQYAIATKLIPATTFWPAEKYHQHYYYKTGHSPYCHRWKKIF